MNNEQETTFYRFYSEIRAFISKLLKTPTNAEPNKYLEDRGITKGRLIKLLMDNEIIKRDERVLIPDKDNVKHVTYCVKYKLKSKNFEDKIERIHRKYFGSDKLNESGIIKKNIIQETNNKKMTKKVIFSEEQMKYICECSGVNPDEIAEATTCGGVGASTTRGDVGYDTPGFDMSDKSFWGGALNHQRKK